MFRTTIIPMPPISLETLTRRVIDYFRRYARRYHLNSGSVLARYVTNWGGFVNASFVITDGQQNYHLKLSDDGNSRYLMAYWLQNADILASRYHAPSVIDWIDIPRTEFGGVLMEWIPGKKADLFRQPEVLAGVLDLLARLHQDQELVQLYGIEGRTVSCLDSFLETYIDRFDEDLQGIFPELPAFIDLRLFDWMASETRQLEALSRESEVFQLPAASPIHGDLWEDNILVNPDGKWWVIDWDDLTVGDPALDYAVLLAPLWLDHHFSDDQIKAHLPGSETSEFYERFNLYLRAAALDQVIDSLADWVESQYNPAETARIQPLKEAAHRRALEFYRSRYPE